MLIDSHIHLYAEQFTEDLSKVMQEAEASKVKAFVLPNIDSGSINSMLAIQKQYPDKCFPAMGLHPCSVNENFNDELEVVREHLFGSSKYYAVGELGIDMHWDTSTLGIQKEALKRQMEWASELELPIIIHSRKSTQLIIEVIKELKSLNNTGVFHCFSGNENEAKAIIDLGFYLGIGGVVTFKNGGLDKSLQDIDLKHMLVETDAPYLAPTPHRGKRNEPKYLVLIVNKLAELKRTSVENVERVTTGNTISLFNLPIND